MSSELVNQMLQSLATIFQSSNMVTRATRIYMRGLKEMDTSLILRDCQHILLVFIHLYGHVTIWNTPSKQGMREKVRAAKWWTRRSAEYPPSIHWPLRSPSEDPAAGCFLRLRWKGFPCTRFLGHDGWNMMKPSKRFRDNNIVFIVYIYNII